MYFRRWLPQYRRSLPNPSSESKSLRWRQSFSPKRWHVSIDSSGIIFKTIVTFIQLNTYSVIDIKTRLTVTIYHCMYSIKAAQFYLDTWMNIDLQQMALNQPSCSSVPSFCYGQKCQLSQGVGFGFNFLRVKEWGARRHGFVSTQNRWKSN